MSRNPTVAYDASWADANRTGAPQVARLLLDTMRTRSDVRIVPFVMRSPKDLPGALSVMRRADFTLIPGQLAGPRAAFVRRAARRIVVYVLDGIALARPDYFASPRRYSSALRSTRALLARSAHVVYLSRAAKDQIDRLGLVTSSTPTSVAYPGCEHFPIGRPSPALSGPPSIACVGTAFEHKRRIDAIELVTMLDAGTGGPRLHLIGGEPAIGSTLPSERALARALSADTDQVDFVVGASDMTVAELLRTSRLCVTPSREEGFGFVPFQAARQGVASVVHASDAASEVLPAECLADFRRLDETAALVDALLNDPARAARLAGALLTRSRDFRWADTAAHMAGVVRGL